ncbi:MAG: hypothetical protein GY865_03360, partial [candidate division Zixibacteria bacterium]|nr:hypothetical protein [candidate division Zixibacteria bacterium]
MRKLLLLTVLLTFIIGMSASATETRLESMGMGDFWFDGTYVTALNTVVKDDANISMYPSTINYYPNIFWGEVDSHEYYYYSKSIYDRNDFFYKAGALFQKGDKDDPFVFGFHFSTVPYESDFNHNLYNYDDDEQTNHRMNLYYGRNLSDMPFGFTFGYYRSSAKNENDLNSSITSQYEDSYNRYEFGFGLSPMEGKLELALSLAMTGWTDKDYETYTNGSGVVDETEPDGNLELGLKARYFMEPKGNFHCVPHFAFMTSKYGEKVFSELTTGDWGVNRTEETKVTVLDLGWGTNYHADEDVLVVADFGVSLGTYKYSTDYAESDDEANEAETKRNYNAMPYFKLGIDAKVFKWMDFRAGVSSLWNGYKYEYAYTDYTYKNSESYTTTQTFLGVGMHWGALEIDALLDPEFLLN